MVNTAPLNGLEMAMDIRFNRKLTKNDYVVPGGYEMVFGDRSIQFDFQDYYGSINDDNPTVLHCEMEHPDFSSFEDFRSVSADDLRNISEIVECYVYIGDECDPELKEVEILAITFWLAAGDSVDVSKEVMSKYNINPKNFHQ